MRTPLRVLMVEDAEDDALLVLFELKGGGFETAWERVQTAEALTAALTRQDWDLILCDWVMPQFSAPAALQTIREYGFDGPIIIVSGEVGEEVAVTAMKGGAHDFVSKQKLARLVPAVQRELRDAEDRRGRRRAEEALRASEERFRLLAENAHDVVFRYRLQPELAVEYVSPAVMKLTGYTQEQFYADPVLPAKLVHPNDLERYESLRRDSVVTRDLPVVMRWIRKDGSVVWTEHRYVAVRDHTGAVVATEGIARDITDRKLAEEALNRTEEHFWTSLDNMLDSFGIYSTIRDASGGIVDFQVEYLNAAACASNPMTKEEQIGKRLLDLMPAHRESGLFEQYCQVVETGTPLLRESVVYEDARNDQRLLRAFDVRAVKLDDGFVATWRDVTACTRAEQDAQQLNAELDRRVRERTADLALANQELDAFTYAACHDLRAPLRVIDGFSQLLWDQCEDRLDDEGKVYIQRVRAAAGRMGWLIDDLLDLARVTRAELRYGHVNLSTLAREIAAELQAADPARLVTFVLADAVVGEGDPTLLRAVLENLLGNAWKYTRKRARARIEFATITDEYGCSYFVRDNGAGFDMTYADRLFRAFQRLHSSDDFEGTGIGLATVQRIVHRHGGRVWAEGAVDQGATFYFTLGEDRA